MSGCSRRDAASPDQPRRGDESLLLFSLPYERLATFLYNNRRQLPMDLQRKLFIKKMSREQASSGAEDLQRYSSEAKDELTPLRPPSPPMRNSYSSDSIDSMVSLPTWEDFFEKRSLLRRGDDTFRVYYTEPKSAESPVFVFHHGAGSSALSFALLASSLVEGFEKDTDGKKNGCGIMAFDCRGHGETRVMEKDYKLDSLIEDAIFVIQTFREKANARSNSIFLIGHSLGGAVLTGSCYRLVNEFGVDVKGLGMLDIVEDTAVHSLQGMHTYLSNLPKSFGSLQSAIDWHLKTGLIRNKTSAEVSVPSYFKRLDSGRYVWRIDLSQTAEYWNTWFVGLSKQFVSAPTSKLLILAGTDSLDRELMIGQMQGKYQLVVFQDSGHFIQEDVPKKTALTLIDFWKRNDKKVVVIKSTWGTKK